MGHKKSKLLSYFATFGFTAIIAIVILKTAWVSDDAFITFRVVDNFWNGYGLRWNISERVWVYTHPLWLFLLIVAYPIINDLYYLAIFLGLIFTTITIYLILRETEGTVARATVAAIILASSAFIDFSTSGLENSLSYFLITLFAIHVLKNEISSINWFFLAFLAGAGILTRPDLGVFFISAIIFLSLQEKPSINLYKKILMGLLPFLLWEMFALFYYGTFIPNTALAKLNHGIPRIELIGNGIAYLFDTLKHDMLTIFAIISVPFLAIYLVCIRKELGLRQLSIIVGVFAFFLYVILIGGDFMRGRFFSLPFVAAVTFIAFYAHFLPQAFLRSMLVILIVYLAFSLPYFISPKYHDPEINSSGIADERGFYYQYTGLINYSGLNWYNHIWADMAQDVNDEDFVVRCPIGIFGYMVPPSAYIIDPHALTEPFLAHLPAKQPFRIGHFERNFPSGYLQSKIEKANLVSDNYLSALYRDVSIATQGNLLSIERFAAIVRLNFGAHYSGIKFANFDSNATGEGIVKVPQRGMFTCMGVPGEYQPQLRFTNSEWIFSVQ